MKRFMGIILAITLLTGVAGADTLSKPATEATARANAAWYDRLDFSDEREFENAARGLIEAPESVAVYKENGDVAWSVSAADYQGQAPESANPTPS